MTSKKRLCDVEYITSDVQTIASDVYRMYCFVQGMATNM